MTKSTCSIGLLSDSTLGTVEGIDAFTFCVFIGLTIKYIYDIII